MAAKYKYLNNWFLKLGPALACLTALSLPLKLSLAYCFLVPFVVLWLLTLGPKLLEQGLLPLYHRVPLAVPLFVFILVAALSSLAGIDPSRSLPKFIGLAFFALAIPAYRDALDRVSAFRVLGCLVAGQTIAALHTVIEAAYPEPIPKLFLGQVTESGQLALTIPISLGLTLACAYNIKLLNPFPGSRTKTLAAAFMLLQLGLLLLAGFGSYLELSPTLRLICSGIFFTIAGLVIFRILVRRDSASTYFWTLCLVCLPLLITAILINLKRGPWIGVFVASIVFLWIYRRSFVLPLVSAAVFLLLVVEPMRLRLLMSSQHFFISGGRSTMWRIGSELALRYPLGIGYHNSPFLRRFALDIPPQHTHFHNNFLNILVETGWLGFGIYLWWLTRLIKTSFAAISRSWTDLTASAIGCALISWQAAGIVEYNFGDSEVVNLALLLVGVLSYLRASVDKSG